MVVDGSVDVFPDRADQGDEPSFGVDALPGLATQVLSVLSEVVEESDIACEDSELTTQFMVQLPARGR